MAQIEKAKIAEVLTDEISIILGLGKEAIKADVPLHSLGFDSLSFVELLVVIEKKFQVTLIDTDLKKDDFKSIDALADKISKIHG